MISKTIQSVIDAFSKFSGIGPRQAQRLAFELLKLDKKELGMLADAISALGEKIKLCPICFQSYEASQGGQKTCQLCANQKRNRMMICVVEKETDIDPIEKTGAFKGVYHVIGENIDVFEKTPPKTIQRLLDRIAFIKKQLPKTKQESMEIILAMNATVESDALALYLEKLIKPLGVIITKLGRGLASGSELEFVDHETIENALLNRKSRF